VGARVCVAVWKAVWSRQPPSPLLSSGGKVHSVGGKSTTAISGNGEVVPGGSRCYDEWWSLGAEDILVNGGGGVADVEVSSARR
jgi:hypothetical protein